MKILFLTRKYPPVVGGMEKLSYNLATYFKKINPDSYIIANRKGNKYLPLFLPYSFFKSLFTIWRNKVTHLHVGDGLLAPEGNLLRKLTGVKTTITIHGLDITWNKSIYQKMIPRSISKFDKIICISNHTKEECIKRKISENKIKIIPIGINPEEFVINEPFNKLRKRLEERLKINIKDKIILFTNGRLVKRKGVEWFVSNVMPKLKKNYIYLVSGDGDEYNNIKYAIDKNNLKERVLLLGRTDIEFLKLLYNTSDIFIMPNIHIEGNMEGFGFVALESGSCGLPVIASAIEGIKDAVIDGKTGYLVNEKDVKAYLKKIKNSKLDRKKVRAEVKKRFDWENIVKLYIREMK